MKKRKRDEDGRKKWRGDYLYGFSARLGLGDEATGEERMARGTFDAREIVCQVGRIVIALHSDEATVIAHNIAWLDNYEAGKEMRTGWRK